MGHITEAIEFQEIISPEEFLSPDFTVSRYDNAIQNGRLSPNGSIGPSFTAHELAIGAGTPTENGIQSEPVIHERYGVPMRPKNDQNGNVNSTNVDWEDHCHKRHSNLPIWAQQRTPSRTLWILLAVIVCLVVFLAAVIPIIWVYSNTKQKPSSTTTLPPALSQDHNETIGG